MHKVKMSLALFVTALFLAQAAPTARAGRLPGDTITNSKGTTLQYSVTNCILALERDLAPGCKRTRIIQTAIVGEPNRVTLRIMRWNERWTIDRCGTNVIYLIHFDFRGSIGNFKIQPPLG